MERGAWLGGIGGVRGGGSLATHEQANGANARVGTDAGIKTVCYYGNYPSRPHVTLLVCIISPLYLNRFLGVLVSCI